MTARDTSRSPSLRLPVVRRSSSRRNAENEKNGGGNQRRNIFGIAGYPTSRLISALCCSNRATHSGFTASIDSRGRQETGRRVRRRARPSSLSPCPKTTEFLSVSLLFSLCLSSSFSPPPRNRHVRAAARPPLINITIKKRAGVPERPAPRVDPRAPFAARKTEGRSPVAAVTAGDFLRRYATPKNNAQKL